MAGMTDTAFRRLVKRHGGCGLVVTEMVSSEGLVRGIDRTLEYAEYTEEERPISIQIFGGDPEKMADAAQIVEGLGADIVDVNMGCPVPKIAKHSAGCSLMRDPAHAATVIAAMTSRVSGVLVGRGVLRNPWILAQAADLAAGRPAREVTLEDRGRFLLDYMDLLLSDGDAEAEGFRHKAGSSQSPIPHQSPMANHESAMRKSHRRWVINKMRALMSWYSKGLHAGGQLRTAINSCESTDQAREIVGTFFAPARDGAESPVGAY